LLVFSKEADSNTFPLSLNLANLQKRKQLTIKKHAYKYAYIQQNCVSVIGNVNMFSGKYQPYRLLEKIKTDGTEHGSYEEGLWD